MSTEEVLKRLLALYKDVAKCLDLWGYVTESGCNGVKSVREWEDIKGEMHWDVGGIGADYLHQSIKIIPKTSFEDINEKLEWDTAEEVVREYLCGNVEHLCSRVGLTDDFKVSFATALHEIRNTGAYKILMVDTWRPLGLQIWLSCFNREDRQLLSFMADCKKEMPVIFPWEENYETYREWEVLHPLNLKLCVLFCALDDTLTFLCNIAKDLFLEQSHLFIPDQEPSADGQSQNPGQEDGSDGASLQMGGETSTGEDGGRKSVLPAELDTEEGRRLLQKTIDAGLCDERYRWKRTKALLAYYIDKASEFLELGNGTYSKAGVDVPKTSWQPFEVLFGEKDVKQNKKGYQNGGKVPRGSEIVDGFFE